MTIISSLLLSLLTFNNLSASDSNMDSGSEGDTSNDYKNEVEQTIDCPLKEWTRIEYFDSYDNLIGTYYVHDGILISNYVGPSAKSIISHGSTGGFTGTAINCFGFGTGCTEVSATEACEED